MSNRQTAKTKSSTFDLDAFLAAEPDLPERRVPMCLKPNLIAERDLAQAEYDGLKARYDKAAENKTALATDGSEVRKAQATAQKAQEAVDAASVEFVIRAMPGPKYKTLKAKYPPRDGNALDRALNYNTDEFFPVLTLVCLAEPKLTNAKFDRLIERMTDAQATRLFNAAFAVNEGEDGAVPSFRGQARK